MDWFLGMITVLANWLVSKRSKWGWAVLGLVNIVWIYYALVILNPPQFGLMLPIILNLTLAIKTFFNWSNKNEL